MLKRPDEWPLQIQVQRKDLSKAYANQDAGIIPLSRV